MSIPHLPTTRLLLIRHGESVANAERRMQGWGDDPLSPVGEAQAGQLADWLSRHNPQADMLISSPLQRAYQTASIIAEPLGLPVVHTRDGLRELGLGHLENVSDTFLDAAIEEGDIEERYGVEPLHVFAERALGALFGLVAVYSGSTLVVVCHGGVVGVALSYWLHHDLHHTWSHYGFCRNTSLTELVFGEQVMLAYHNRVEHLASP